MQLKELQELIEFISRSDFSRFEMENEGFRLKLVRGRSGGIEPHGPVLGPLPNASPEGVVEGNGRPEGAAGPAAAAAAELHEIKSPIVGTFYRAPSPQSAPFVEAGTRISTGQPLCIIEAMKLMNEIESDVDGEVVEILVASGHPVEYGQVLFRIRPAGA